MRGKMDTVSVDRLKPSHKDIHSSQPFLDPNPLSTATAATQPPTILSPSPTSQPTPPSIMPASRPPVSTRTGQQVQFPSTFRTMYVDTGGHE